MVTLHNSLGLRVISFTTMVFNLCVSATHGTPVPHDTRIDYGTFTIPAIHNARDFEEFSIRAALPCYDCRITHAEIRLLDPDHQIRTPDVLLDHIIFCNNTARQDGDRCRGESLGVVEPGVVETIIMSEEDEEEDEVMSQDPYVRKELRRRRPRSGLAGHYVPSTSRNGIFILTGKLESSGIEPKAVSLSIKWTFDRVAADEERSAADHDGTTVSKLRRRITSQQSTTAIYKSSSVRYRRTTAGEPTADSERELRHLHDDVEWWVITLLIVALSGASVLMAVVLSPGLRSWFGYCLGGGVTQRPKM